MAGYLATLDFEAPCHEVNPNSGLPPWIKSLPGQAPGKQPASFPPSADYLSSEVFPTVLSPTRISRNWKSKTGGRGRFKMHQQSRAQSIAAGWLLTRVHQGSAGPVQVEDGVCPGGANRLDLPCPQLSSQDCTYTSPSQSGSVKTGCCSPLVALFYSELSFL